MPYVFLLDSFIQCEIVVTSHDLGDRWQTWRQKEKIREKQAKWEPGSRKRSITAPQDHRRQQESKGGTVTLTTRIT